MPTVLIQQTSAPLAAGAAVRQGVNPYIITPQLAAGLGGAADTSGPNLNAPSSLLLFSLLPSSAPGLELTLSRIASLLTYCVCIALLWHNYPRSTTSPTHRLIWWLWPFALVGLTWTILLGQVYVFLLLLLCSVIALLRRDEDVRAGLLLGLVAAIKPNFLLCSAALFVGGRRRAGLTSGVVAGLLNAFALLKFHPHVLLQWLTASQMYVGVGLPHELSIRGDVWRLALPGWSSYVASLVVVLVLGFWIWRAKPEPPATLLGSLAAMLLISPVAWTANTIWLLPAWFMVRPWRWELKMALGILLLPEVGMLTVAYTSPFGRPLIGFVYSAAVALVGLGILRGQPLQKDGRFRRDLLQLPPREPSPSVGSVGLPATA